MRGIFVRSRAVSSSTQIYVELIDEAVLVWRPVQAVHLRDSVYRISTQDYDREDETWEFEPGDVVRCENVNSSDGPILVAIERAT
ncbi:MAG: hypothetical protein CMJ31_09995 [Phycisphaerae bacterium]|nr:hypothetical protein [Phycisphaerae bacterium]